MKKNIIKKLVTLSLAGLLTFSIAGCGGADTSAASNSTITQKAAEAEAEKKAEIAEKTQETINEVQARQFQVDDESTEPISFADENGNPAKVVLGINTDADLIWDAVKTEAAKYDIDLEVTTFSNVNLNQLLADGEIDLNAFQHYSFFEQNTADLGVDLTPLGEMYILRLDLYSTKYDSIDELPDGATIAVPNTAVNISRALKQFERAGILTVDPAVGDNPAIEDIIDNPKNLQFVELDKDQIARALDDVDAGIVFVREAIDSGLDPDEDTILTESVNPQDPDQKRWINLIVARTEDKDDPVLNQIIKCFQTDAVGEAILEQYHNAAIPAWDEKYVTE